MSGGAFGYQEHKIRDAIESVSVIMEAVAQSEHIVDWAESGDTTRRREDGSGAERDLYDLWLKTFERLYG